MKKKLPLIYHIHEFKIKIFYLILSILISCLISFKYKICLIYLLSFKILKNKNFFIYTEISEAFFSFLKLSISFSIINLIPFFFYLTIFFLGKGYFNYKLKLLIKLIFFISLYFIIIIKYYSNFLFIYISNFFLSFEYIHKNSPIIVSYEGKISSYINYNLYICSIILIWYLFFIIILILSFTYFNLKKRKKYLYLSFFILYLIFIPPDIILQVFLLILSLLFIELYIFFSVLIKQYLIYIEKLWREQDSNLR